MGILHVTATVRNPADPSRSWSGRFLVDTGAIDSLVPRQHLDAIGLVPKRQRVYELADGREITMDVTSGDIEFLGELTAGVIICGDPDAEPLLGVTALESAGIEVDPQNQRLKKLPAVRLKGALAGALGGLRGRDVPRDTSCGADSWAMAGHAPVAPPGGTSREARKDGDMSSRTVSSACAVIVGAAFLSLAVAPAAAQDAVPRTPWGHPDLQGVWDFRTITPLERPAELADREFLTAEEAASLEQDVAERDARLLDRAPERTAAGGNVDRRDDGTPGFYNNFWLDTGTSTIGTRRTSLIVDPPNGRIPDLTASGQRRAEAQRAYQREHPADSWLDLDAGDRCLLGLNAGPPIVPAAYNQNLQVFQTPDHVMLLTEMVHTVRAVPLDGRPPLPEHIRQWSGDSRGRWEGDTLVIETTNFVDDRRWTTSNPMGALGSSQRLTLVERLTRIDADTLDYTFTVTDPEWWPRPWTASIPMRRSDAPLFEYACHEGNYSMANMLAGARAEERAAEQP